MLRNIPFKKEYGLFAATVVLLLISYQLAFKKTIAAWQLNNGLKKQLEQSADLSYQPGYFERKNTNLSRVINLYKADTADFRGNIIGTISSLAEKNKVKLTEAPVQDPLYHTDEFIIQKLNFEGDFFSLIQLLNQLQAAKGTGLPRAATFKVAGIRSNNDDAKKLVLEVYLEVAR